MKKNFNILAAINKQLKSDVIVPYTPKEYVVDPNKITWPYLRYNQLKPDTEYIIRFLPPYSPGCPDGYVYKEMYTIPYELDLNPKGGYARHQSHYVSRPLDGSEDPISEVMAEFHRLLNSDTPRGEDLRKDIQEIEEFREFMKTLAKPWGQYTFPVLIYATCDAVREGDNKYTTYSNYLPDKRRKNYQFRLFQINNVNSVKKVIDNFQPLTLKSPEDYEGPIFDTENGLDMKFSHTSGKPKMYLFTTCDSRTPLPSEVIDKLAMEGNLCNIVERELESVKKTPGEMMNILRSSSYSGYLYKHGLIV